ncbi:uncharacterized protein PODANS_3_4740 [Podospora anserina S mat+]|uniref:Podospora anserina S mat+ genomic DNA chromosome 3, supercontig 2 n=1 Tax=Podospora anserina (strain S / ATCC MYA-4624 / DSM 980 / FGSC 10383) TaxID=515849 RepID=B2AZK7_PODAN|nr:uncharacterized protein PODANS_3_4740 [Podospora anserina S mat+]CAP70395.1 unnamed protein product [Podospora anserina S mat+]
MGGGPKIPYPKHVWSPAGGWYAQPANWKANTAILGVCVFGITAMVWNLSAEREFRHKMPEPGRFYPSRSGANKSSSTSGRKRKRQRQRRSHHKTTVPKPARGPFSRCNLYMNSTNFGTSRHRYHLFFSFGVWSLNTMPLFLVATGFRTIRLCSTQQPCSQHIVRCCC